MNRPLGALALFALGLAAVASGAEPAYDVVLRGGRVIDGTGAPWYVADVGVRDGKIVAIGRLADGQRTIDATGLIVAPGFIDMMGQSATSLLENPAAAVNLLSQGITTINCGEGVSAAPPTDETARRGGWRTMSEYFQLLDMRGLPVNVTQTVGHTQARLVVIGDVDRRPTPDELKKMQAHVREAMEAGAIGLSTSLIYPPAVYADTAEITALAQVAGEYGGRYYTHMRNEGDRLLEAIDEALEIGRNARTPVHIFHLKAAGRQNWGKMDLAIARIKAARATGQSVAADVYPYINNGLGAAALVHPRHFADGDAKLRARLPADKALRATIRQEMENDTGWENWYRHVGQDWNRIIVGAPNDERYAGLGGKSLAAIAQAKGEDPWTTFFHLVAAGAFVLPESMSDANVIRAMQQEFVSFCTDVGPAGGSRISSHPRAFGAFPRLLSRYVRDLGVLSLERAVAQASAAAANEVLAYDRGRIALGLAADLIVFDPQQLADRATFAEPQAQAVGMRYVLVNGQLAWDDGRQTNRRPGRVLRGPGYKPAIVPDSPKPESRGAQGAMTLDRFFQAFLDRHRVPGCAVAITHEGRLVYARGFGWGDVAERRPVTPTSLFRIASISKPITAVAILKLVEQGKLKLDDRVFDILNYEPHLEGDAKFDERQREITIRHLLSHRGGWDRDRSFDAMFQSVRFANALKVPPPADQATIIRCMLGQPLDFPPGERYAYSNYGYCLLGRVIEQRTGTTYEAYVRKELLEPVGIRSIQLGHSRWEQRHGEEVRYYDPGTGPSVFVADQGQTIPFAYGGFNLEAMDAHGGWLASATELVRFAAALDENNSGPLLRPESLRVMLQRVAPDAAVDKTGKPRPTHYALGWNVREDAAGQPLVGWHTGSLPGTATILMRRADRLNIAVLFNARVSPLAEHLTRDLEGPLVTTLDQIKAWPDGDLFETSKP